MDTLAAHRNRMVRSICRLWKIRVVYLPPYSPEYNPIEKVGAWMKNRLRGRINWAAKCFRYAVTGAWRQAKILGMKNLFRGCGFAQSCAVIQAILPVHLRSGAQDQASFDASQEQLSRLGQHPAAALLGYICLDNVRKQGQSNTGGGDVAVSSEARHKLVPRLAPLRTNYFF